MRLIGSLCFAAVAATTASQDPRPSGTWKSWKACLMGTMTSPQSWKSCSEIPFWGMPLALRGLWTSKLLGCRGHLRGSHQHPLRNTTPRARCESAQILLPVIERPQEVQLLPSQHQVRIASSPHQGYVDIQLYGKVLQPLQACIG